jgi:ketosteroid isomerase-like protein
VYLAQGYAAFDFDLTAGGVTHTVLRATLVLTRRPEGWRIAQHHFSSPPSEAPILPPQAAQS